MFTHRTSSRTSRKSTRTASVPRPTIESLEGRAYFNGAAGFLGGLPGNDTGFLGGYSTSGGAISGILGVDVGLLTQATPDSLAQFVQGVTSGFSPYNLSDPFSSFYFQNPSSNGFGITPFPNYDLWLLMNGYGPQADPTFSSILSPVYDTSYYGSPYGYNAFGQTPIDDWATLLQILDSSSSNVNGTVFNGTPIQAGNNWWDAGNASSAGDGTSGTYIDWNSGWNYDAGNAGSAGDAGSAGNAGSALPAADIMNSVQPPVHSKSDQKLIAQIEKLSAKVGKAVADLTYATTDTLKSVYADLKQLPKKQALIQKIEAAAERTGEQISAALDAMSVSDLKAYLKQINSH